MDYLREILMYIKQISYMSIAKLAEALCLALLVGCSSIPTMVPDMAMQPSHAIQLDGPDGLLTAKQSKAILAKLKKNGDETNIFDKHLALEEEIVGSPLVAVSYTHLRAHET